MRPSVRHAVVDHSARDLAEQVVGATDEDSQHDNREDHHQRVAIKLAPRRPDDLAELIENLTQKLADATFGGRFGALSSSYCHLSPTSSPCGGCAYDPTCSTWGAPSGRDRSPGTSPR